MKTFTIVFDRHMVETCSIEVKAKDEASALKKFSNTEDLWLDAEEFRTYHYLDDDSVEVEE